MNIYTVNDYIKDTFGEKLYKLSLNAGCTCPNRDGTAGYGGCIFCSAKGSGDFGGRADVPISLQIRKEKLRMAGKARCQRYIAYFQSFTNTYGDICVLRKKFLEAAYNPEIAAIDIATRPDCLDADVLELLAELASIKPLWVELGLQTVHERTAKLINRCYPLEVYDDAIEKLKKFPVHIVVHMIIGLPFETEEDMVETAGYISDSGVHGIKFQLLHVLKGTKLAELYEDGLFDVLSLEEYTDILIKCIKQVREDMVIHRITGDGPKSILIAPLWSADKKKTLNYIRSRIEME
ncbi:MAG: TIGR01212 family radical SAM protein [Coprococcus sp.]